MTNHFGAQLRCPVVAELVLEQNYVIVKEDGLLPLELFNVDPLGGGLGGARALYCAAVRRRKSPVVRGGVLGHSGIPDDVLSVLQRDGCNTNGSMRTANAAMPPQRRP